MVRNSHQPRSHRCIRKRKLAVVAIQPNVGSVQANQEVQIIVPVVVEEQGKRAILFIVPGRSCSLFEATIPQASVHDGSAERGHVALTSHVHEVEMPVAIEIRQPNPGPILVYVIPARLPTEGIRRQVRTQGRNVFEGEPRRASGNPRPRIKRRTRISQFCAARRRFASSQHCQHEY